MRLGESHEQNILASWLKQKSNQKICLSSNKEDITSTKTKRQIVDAFEVKTIEYFDVDTWDDEDIFGDTNEGTAWGAGKNFVLH